MIRATLVPSGARAVISVADVFDALTTKRSYKEAWADEAALSELRDLAGRSLTRRWSMSSCACTRPA